MAASTEHEVVVAFQPPDRDIMIWRYMNLPQLIAFLETKSLHFARADTLGDPYEGSWPRFDMAVREQQFMKNFGGDQSKTLKIMTTYLRETIYISCWHVGEAESAAMWQIYGTMAGTVAIQSTYQKLVNALPDDTFMGMVQYRDYSSSDDGVPRHNQMYPFIHKRREFEHEKEARAFIWTSASNSQQRLTKANNQPQGIKVEIDIAKVVDTIRVQPTTPAWARQAIEKLLKRYDWGIKIRSSEIDIEPMY